MTISNPSENFTNLNSFLQTLFEEDQKKREMIANYISIMADEANSLYRIWSEVVSLLEQNQNIDLYQENDELVKKIRKHRSGQMPHFHRLCEFRHHLTEINNSLSKTYTQDFVKHLVTLFNEREITKELYEEKIKEISSNFFLIDRNSRKLDLSKLKQSVDILEKEAQAIYALAEIVRYTPKAGKRTVRPFIRNILAIGFLLVNNIVWGILFYQTINQQSTQQSPVEKTTNK